MKVFSWLARLMFVVSLPLLFASLSVRLVSTNQWFYERGFDNYGISQVTGIERPELVKAAKALIAYFESGDGPVSIQVVKDGKSIPLFNEREIAHLADVRDLFRLTFRIGETAALYAGAFALVQMARRVRGGGRRLVDLIFRGSFITVGIVALLGIGSLIDFEAIFVQFHLISFRNDLWMLDPSRDYLIMMFPEGFWVDATLAVAAFTAAQGLVIGGLSYGFLRRRW